MGADTIAASGISGLKVEAEEFVRTNEQANIVNPFAVAEKFNGKHLTVKGKKVVDLTRLDYLAAGSSAEVKRIMVDAILRNNLSCPCSQKIMKTAPNIALEKAIAHYHGMNESLIFTSGYSANINTMEAIGLRMNTSYLSPICHKLGVGKKTRKIPTLFFVDSESHFSLQHGSRIAESQGGCHVYHFPTGEYEKLERLIANSLRKHGEALRVIVTDTLVSSTGVVADIVRLYKVAEEYDCMLYLDEAHAIGVLGVDGSGVAKSTPGYGENRQRIILMGTLTKTFAQLGGYVSVMDHDVAQFLEFCCPQYIFSAPVPPWMAEALIEILTLIKGDWGNERRSLLSQISLHMQSELNRAGFDTMGASTQIVPVFIGDDENATAMNYFLQENGYIASCFRYPAVSKALLRFSLCSDVTPEEVEDVVRLMKIGRDKFRL